MCGIRIETRITNQKEVQRLCNYWFQVETLLLCRRQEMGVTDIETVRREIPWLREIPVDLLSLPSVCFTMVSRVPTIERTKRRVQSSVLLILQIFISSLHFTSEGERPFISCFNFRGLKPRPSVVWLFSHLWVIVVSGYFL